MLTDTNSEIAILPDSLFLVGLERGNHDLIVYVLKSSGHACVVGYLKFAIDLAIPM